MNGNSSRVMGAFELFLRTKFADLPLSDTEKDAAFMIFRAGWVAGAADATAHHNDIARFIKRAGETKSIPS